MLGLFSVVLHQEHGARFEVEHDEPLLEKTDACAACELVGRPLLKKAHRDGLI